MAPTHAPRRLTAWTATAIVVSQVVGVGIFLTPATMMRTVGGLGPALALWAVMGLLSIAGALCYAELASRYPQAGGGYVFLREAYGERVAFVSGWMALLVTDPGITAALGIGLSQYLLAGLGASPALNVPVAIGAIALFALPAAAGVNASARLLRWTAAAKLAIVAVLVGAGIFRAPDAGALAASSGAAAVSFGLEELAGATIAAFFAFGGWWELGRMAEEVDEPRRTMPRALVGGLLIVTLVYALISVAFVLSAGGQSVEGTDETFVATVGAALFGPAAGRLLALMVVAAVAGSLGATLLSSPRVYVAMARDRLFPEALARFDTARGAAPRATVLQVVLASVLVAFGTFDQVLGYFVPATVFFLGLSAAAVLRLPRPGDAAVFRAPLHPLPITLFLVLVSAILVLFAAGQPRETLIGFGIAALGVPASYMVRNQRAP